MDYMSYYPESEACCAVEYEQMKNCDNFKVRKSSKRDRDYGWELPEICEYRDVKKGSCALIGIRDNKWR